MKPFAVSAVLLLCVVFPVLFIAQVTEVDWDRGADFSRFHSFTWATAAYPIQDPDANLGMARVVQEELEAKGLTYVPPESKFDSFVTYNAAVNQNPKNLSEDLITIKVRIFDASNNSVIWKAGGYVALIKGNREQNRRNVRALLAEMFKQYPPPK